MKWRSLQESGAGLDIRPLREQFAERKELIAKYVPADVQAVHERTVALLKSQELAAKALSCGAKAPPFELPDHNGKPVSTAALLKQGPLVISFIRGRWCPFDVGQMEAMNSIAAHIKAAGASLVAISPQTEKHKLSFPLLVDARNEVARAFGLAYPVPEEQRALYRSTFVNLPFVNGDDSWELPIPATYGIDREGTIRFASAREDYTERPEPLEILAILENAG